MSEKSEPWRNASLSMPGVVRLIYRGTEVSQFHPVMAPAPDQWWPDNPVVAVIGPFDNHTGQGELQERLLEVVRQWNAEVAATAPTPSTTDAA